MNFRPTPMSTNADMDFAIRGEPVIEYSRNEFALAVQFGVERPDNCCERQYR